MDRCRNRGRRLAVVLGIRMPALPRGETHG